MNRNNATKNAAKILSAVISLVLIVMAPSALAVTKANFDKVTATFQWENAATPVPNLNCDDCAQQIDIGFDFPFAGERFNKVWVSSNGVLSLLDPMTEYNNTNLPTSGKGTKTSALIMPYWDDLNPMAGGSVTYATLGSAPNRRLVVSWNKVPQNSCILGILPVCLPMGEYNFQAILYEGGEIKFQYGVGDNNGGDATIGIEVTNDDYIKHSYNRNIIHANEALLFSPQPYVQSVVQPCGSLNSLKVRYSYPMSASASEKQNYDFVSTSTQGLNVTSASLSPDGYTVTLGLNKSLQAGNTYKLQIKDALSRAGRAINPNPTTRPISGSSGLIGTYYSQYGIPRAYHTGPWVQRNDAQVDFAWNRAVPDILPRGDDFSIHWEGYLIPSRTGSHVFRTYSDDGIRLWVNGTKILDAWNDHSPRYHDSSAVSLNAGEAVPIVLEHYERGGQAYARLFWDEPDGTSGNYALIPSSALSPCTLTPTGPDHIRIEHDGPGLTCQAEQITLKACADAACSTEYAGDVTVSLAAYNGGTWSPNPVTFNGHTEVQLSKTTPGDTTLSIASATPPAVNDWDCVVNGNPVSQANCKVNFADAGFVFDVPDLTACETSPSVTLRAVKKNGNNTSCEAALTGNRTVHFWSTYINPDSGTQAVSINVNHNDHQVASSSPGTTISLEFDANGEASFTTNYPDVGRMQLDVRYEGSAATNDAGLVMTGSDQFVARPHHFELSAIKCADGTDNPNPPASNANGAKFCKAGQDFNVQVRAACANGNTTPNFGRESPAESVQLTLKELVAPSHGDKPQPTGSASAFGTDCTGHSAPGVACGTFQWPEVGIIKLTPSILDGDYLGTGDVSGLTSGNVGRFYPHHFELTNPNLAPACGTFSYMGQPFSLTFTLTAKSRDGKDTKNYSGDFAKQLVPSQVDLWRNKNLAPNEHGFALGAKNGTVDLSNRLVVMNPIGSWSEGVAANIMANLTFERGASFDGPYDSLKLGLALRDIDGVTLDASALDMDTDGDDVNERKFLGQTIIRFGRLVLDSANGSEFANLSMPVRAEYYDGSGWRINTEDYCTTVSASDLTEEDVDSSDTLLPEHVTPSGGGLLSAGHSSFTLSAPGAGHTGSLGYRLDVSPWLQFDWKNDGVFNENPSALATFGVYQGNPSIIYQREVWAQ